MYEQNFRLQTRLSSRRHYPCLVTHLQNGQSPHYVDWNVGLRLQLLDFYRVLYHVLDYALGHVYVSRLKIFQWILQVVFDKATM
ncbi:unnamed protein product [Danaus chrysippus]|uniref:(African queen) hypothetical protein n=1 Tax=Danaus chrysippus TaxID=151541 RepID=A0A8J2QTX8_9NEOP|nr:unnamed protein product [Danaus chrysippus]